MIKRPLRQSNFDMELNTWHHMVAVFEISGKTSLYVDQKLVGSTSLSVSGAGPGRRG
jgi:hypothetical protein